VGISANNHARFRLFISQNGRWEGLQMLLKE
jgi:hypothetical protein